ANGSRPSKLPFSSRHLSSRSICKPTFKGEELMNKFRLLTGSVAALGTALMLLGTSGATAQDYPNKPIRLIVPFNAGGGIDTTARFMADKLGEELGTDIIVENIGGGGGSLGAAEVHRSA